MIEGKITFHLDGRVELHANDELNYKKLHILYMKEIEKAEERGRKSVIDNILKNIERLCL